MSCRSVPIVLRAVVTLALLTDVASGRAAVQQTTAIPAVPEVRLEVLPPEPRSAIQGRLEEARARPDDPDRIGALARVLFAWDQWPAAQQALARAAHLAPKTMEWRYLEGIALQRLGRPADAARRFQEALMLAPDYLPARVRRAEALLEAGRVDAAREAYEELIGIPAAEPLAAYGLGRVSAAAGEHDRAAARYRQAVALFPEFGAAYYGLAMAARAQGHREEAQAALEKHEQFTAVWPAVDDPVLRDVAAMRDDVSRLLERGLRLAEAGDLEGAIRAHDEVLERDGSIPKAHANLISLHGRAGHWTEAEKHYQAVLALGSNLDEAHYNYAVALGLQERWEDAAQAYREAIDVNPWHAQAHNNLGQILERQGRLDEATEQYRAAVESQPGYRLARFNLGRMLIASGHNAEAIAAFETLQEPRDEEAPRYLFALSVALVRAGRTAEGLELARDAEGLARQFGQEQLAAAIESELRRLQ